MESTMKHLPSIRSAAWVLAAAFAAAPAAFAQSSPTPAVMSDAQPLPAQDRESMGAILLEDSPVIAQRTAFEQSSARAYAVAERAREIIRAQVRTELAAGRDDPTRTMGGPPAPAK
jgi:hypothetical protein